jgi:uncharacterized protein (TIGR02231 family)
MTKSFSLLLFSFVLTYNVFSQTNLKSEIKDITVFLSGAEIHRTSSINFKKGRNVIVFKGLSASLMKESVRIETSSNVQIMATSHGLNYLTEETDNAQKKKLKDSIEYYNNEIELIENDLDAYKIEKKLLESNIHLSGKQNAVSMAVLKEAADYYRSRIKDINKNMHKHQSGINQLVKRKRKHVMQLQELDYNSSSVHSEITVTLDAQVGGKTNLNLFYLVTDAGWSATYEIRSNKTSAPIDIFYNANVFNNTGFDWTNVSLQISTGEPNLTASRPDLDRWTINDVVRRRRKYKTTQTDKTLFSYEYESNKKSVLSNSQGFFMENDFQALNKKNNDLKYKDQSGKKGKKTETVKFKEIAVSELSRTFDIKDKYTIPSNAKPYIIKVTKYEIPASYSYISVPKIDRDAFLIAKITDWEDLDLVEGPAQVYFGGNYVGKSYINTQFVPDTLELSLGRDNNIAVTRVKKKKFSSKKIIGTNKKEIYLYEITVKNARDVPVQIEILDQLPISTDSEVSVSTGETSDATVNETEGLLSWKITLAAKESKKVTFGFTVKYPKNKKILLKKFTPVSSPSF